MTEQITLTTGGPDSPRYTRLVAEHAAEAIRVLNHHTGRLDLPGPRALEYPADAAAVFGSLATAVSRMPQLLKQIGGWLLSEQQAGRLTVDYGSYNTPAAAAAAVVSHLAEASDHLGAAWASLDRAYQVANTIGGADGGTDG